MCSYMDNNVRNPGHNSIADSVDNKLRYLTFSIFIALYVVPHDKTNIFHNISTTRCFFFSLFF